MDGDTLTKSAMMTVKVAAGAVLAAVMTLCLWITVIDILE
jgi:hypothetical protein